MAQPRRIRLMLSLDYELFFGPVTGSVDACLLTPVERLLETLSDTDIKFTLFADAAFLYRLQQQGSTFPQLATQFERIREQLLMVSRQGHNVQLHIHPHWEDCYFDGQQWQMNTERYRLQDFSAQDITERVKRYKGVLASCTENEVFAYRAGGWCIQPFSPLRDALIENGIWLDSTTYQGGFRSEEARFFDFRSLPQKPWWRFNHDPCIVDDSGPFLEVPISAYRLPASFFWQFAVLKRFGRNRFRTFGDGQAMPNTHDYYWQRLTKPTLSPVMIDGFKAGQLERGLKEHTKTNPHGVFNVMGHPKSLTSYSLAKLKTFVLSHPEISSVTPNDFSLEGLEVEHV